MNILVPLTITDAMFTACSVAEPDTTETAWVSAASYTLGDKRIRTTTHRVYQCILTHSGRTALPEADELYWSEYDPTVKWAAFDTYVSTQTTDTSPLTFTIAAGFYDAVSMYGLTGTSVTLTHKATPGGTVLETRTISLYAESLGLYEYLFGVKNPKSKIVESGFESRPAGELSVSISGTGTVGAGMINIGTYRSILGEWGGTIYGASVEPTTTSRIKTNEATGKVSIKRGNAASGLRVTVQLPIEAANYALQTMQEVLDVPVSVIASDATGYEGLNVFGLASASMVYPNYGLATLSVNVKGMI